MVTTVTLFDITGSAPGWGLAALATDDRPAVYLSWLHISVNTLQSYRGGLCRIMGARNVLEKTTCPSKFWQSMTTAP